MFSHFSDNVVQSIVKMRRNPNKILPIDVRHGQQGRYGHFITWTCDASPLYSVPVSPYPPVLAARSPAPPGPGWRTETGASAGQGLPGEASSSTAHSLSKDMPKHKMMQ